MIADASMLTAWANDRYLLYYTWHVCFL